MKWQRALALGTAAVAAFTLVALASRGTGDATRTASSGSEVLSDGDGDFATVVALASPARVRPDVSLDAVKVGLASALVGQASNIWIEEPTLLAVPRIPLVVV